MVANHYSHCYCSLNCCHAVAVAVPALLVRDEPELPVGHAGLALHLHCFFLAGLHTKCRVCPEAPCMRSGWEQTQMAGVR